MKQAMRVGLKSHICKYFACYIILQLFENNSKAKLVVTVSYFLFTVKYKASVGLCVEK